QVRVAVVVVLLHVVALASAPPAHEHEPAPHAALLLRGKLADVVGVSGRWGGTADARVHTFALQKRATVRAAASIHLPARSHHFRSNSKAGFRRLVVLAQCELLVEWNEQRNA